MNTVDESPSEVFQVRVDRFISKKLIDSSYLISIIAFSRKVQNNSYFQYKFVKTVLPSHSNPHTKFMWHNTVDIRSLVKLAIEFNCPFFISYKILPYYLYYYCIMIVGTSFFPARFASFHTHASLLTFFNSFFVLFRSCCSMRECLGKLLHEFPCPI